MTYLLSFNEYPSFSRRKKFILYTSLPHEILHNWWGNGVFVDFAKGNWSEGLTAYMADHFNDEQKGKDKEYRRKALERYANYAAEGRDIALADFSSRHDEASQAVGSTPHSANNTQEPIPMAHVSYPKRCDKGRWRSSRQTASK